MNDRPRPPKRIFPSSKIEAKSAEHVPSIPQTESSSYKLAFQDTEFLLRPDLRPVRFQLELLKPELLLEEAKIGSTFVFYGSARIPAPAMADALVAAAANKEQEAVAERLKAKSSYYDVARELARSVIPVGAYTQFYWTVNARALMNFISLRNAEFAQLEIRRFAEAVEAFFEQKMPVTHAAFVANERTAP